MNKRKKLLIVSTVSLAVAGLIAFGCGCKSITSISTDANGNAITNVTKTLDVARAASVGKQAATVGTTEILRSHPEWRPKFELAESDLRALATSPSIGLQDILNIAQRLPVKELKSDTARLSFELGTITISAINVPDLPVDKLAELQPIALAIADGVAVGLAASPPVPAPATN